MVASNTPRKTKIFVGRLPENCRNEELRSLFTRFGEVTECDVMHRYGFVHMAREEEAAMAIKALHNTNFKGATINVEQSTGKSRGGGPRGRDDRRGGPMRGGRGIRDGGRDARPGPYTDRRVVPIQLVGYDGSTGGGVAGGYQDYNRGGGDFNRGDFSGGYSDRGGYGQNVGGGGMGGYQSQAPGMGGGYGPQGAVGNYGPTGTPDYGRNDYGRPADFGARTDYSRGVCDYSGVGGGMVGDFNRGAPGPVDYGRTDTFNTGRVDYQPRNDYDRGAAGPMRNGSGAVAAGGYGAGYSDVGYEMPMSGAPTYNTGGPSYNTGPPQADMFSRRPGGAAPVGGYQVGAGYGYSEGYDRPDPYAPPRGAGRFPGPADAMPPRY